MTQVTRESLQVVADDLIDLILKKNHDYGDAWRKKGVAGVLVRLSDKSTRLETLEGKQALVVDESWRQTVRDIAAYSLLVLLDDEGE